MPDKFKTMNDKFLGHYIYHAIKRSHEWLNEKVEERKGRIQHFNNALDGGILKLDEGRGDLDFKGIKNWTYDDVCPNLNISFKDRFKTPERFEAYRQNEIITIEQKLIGEDQHKVHYEDIDTIKDRIDQGKIIVCSTEEELNKKAKAGDRKLKTKVGKTTLMAVIKK